MTVKLNEVDKVEILTLQDNYVDVAAFDSTEIVQRALPVKDMEIKNSILAEHGFSAIVTVYADDTPHSILFDFGFSEHGAAYNADALEIDLSAIEAMVLSHGHMDHFGGLAQLAERVGKNGIELVLHPTAFRTSRYVKISEEFKIKLPSLARQKIEKAGISIVESKEPRMLLSDTLLFLGEIPKQTDFEKGFPKMHYDEDQEEKWDPIEEDTAIVINIKGKDVFSETVFTASANFVGSFEDDLMANIPIFKICPTLSNSSSEASLILASNSSGFCVSSTITE